jgi:hypothetical protein
MADTKITREEAVAAARELLDKLRRHNESAFWQVLAPYIAEGVQIADVLVAVASCRAATLAGDAEQALA